MREHVIGLLAIVEENSELVPGILSTTKSRKHSHILAKRVFCVIVREEYPSLSLEQIGSYLGVGSLNHAAVIHHLKGHEKEYEAYEDYTMLYNTCRRQFDELGNELSNVTKSDLIKRLSKLYADRVSLEKAIATTEQRITNVDYAPE